MAESDQGRSLVINELLCYINNNFLSDTKSKVIDVIVGFYNEKEIFEAKTELFNRGNDFIVDEKNETIEGWSKIVNGKGHLINRRDITSNVEDVWWLFSTLKANTVALPTYVASRTDRLPPAPITINHRSSPQSDALLESITKRLTSIERRLEEKQATAPPTVIKSSDRNGAAGLKSSAPPPGPAACADISLDSPIPPKKAPTTGNTWAGKVLQGERNVPTSPLKIKIKGTNVKTEIKTVPRKKVIAAFVGRLDLSTTEDSLIACLTKAGVTDVKCSKLKGNGNRVFKTSAFFVSCNENCHETFYNCNTWPEGAELRDWVFH